MAARKKYRQTGRIEAVEETDRETGDELAEKQQKRRDVCQEKMQADRKNRGRRRDRRRDILLCFSQIGQPFYAIL